MIMVLNDGSSDGLGGPLGRKEVACIPAVVLFLGTKGRASLVPHRVDISC